MEPAESQAFAGNAKQSDGESPGESSHSVTRLLHRLRTDEPEAAGQLWRRYIQRLIPLARAKLAGLNHAAVDEDDVLNSVFARLFHAVKEDRFSRLSNRNDLWQILLMLTERKVSDHYRQAAAQRRGGDVNAVRIEGETAEILASPEPPPEVVAAFNENLVLAMGRLEEPSTREVAVLRMEGYENGEIAARLGISLSSVERKLRVVREVWREIFNAPSESTA